VAGSGVAVAAGDCVASSALDDRVPSHAATLTRASSGLPVEQQAAVTALLRTLGLHAADLPKAGVDDEEQDEAQSA